MFEPSGIAAPKSCNDEGQHGPGTREIEQGGERVFRVGAERFRKLGIGEQLRHFLFERLVEIATAIGLRVAIA